MATQEPMKGPGCCQWSTGGWFGSQLGGTFWMLVGAAQFALRSPLIGFTWLVCFGVANAIGTSLWLKRDQLRPYRALQVLLLVIAACGLAALVVFDVLQPADGRLDVSSANDGSLSGVMGAGDRRRVYLGLLVGVPLGLVWADLMERSSRAAKAQAQGQG